MGCLARCGLLLAFVGSLLRQNVFASPSLVVTMICRDEDVNLKANLPLWASFADFFVFLLDERTSDNSSQSIAHILGEKGIPFVVQNYTFLGFGDSRTLSLKTAHDTFPQASHVIIADPDWRPDLSTIEKSQLDTSAEVFRFTVFDRNGITRRRMDWMLLHRAGLKMKYGIHEVLDIGYYSVKEVGWVIREIEQRGTWHATVGHGFSMSRARYDFDLSLLYQDLPRYPHDPHVDYYLGITHHAHLQTVYDETRVVDENDLRCALHYLKKRATATYADDFVEQRWAAMFILGSTYHKYKNECIESVRWLRQCRDYNPSHFECGAYLIYTLQSCGMMSEALVELKFLLQQQPKERLMLNVLNIETCMVPKVVMEVYPLKAELSDGGFSEADALFVLTMLRAAEEGHCEGLALSVPAMDKITAALAQANSSLSVASGLQDLCSNPLLRQLLVELNVHLHPCRELRLQVEADRMCRSSHALFPPANEDLHSQTWLGGFLGAALLGDVVTAMYAGDWRVVYRRTSPLLEPSAFPFDATQPYTMLFPKHFHTEILLSVLGDLLRGGGSFEVHVIAESPVQVNEIRRIIHACWPAESAVVLNRRLHFHAESGSLLGALRSLHSRGLQFDYIESNGALSSLSVNDIASYMKTLRSLLTPLGVVGLTFVNRNHHTEALASLLRERDTSAHRPFSLDPRHLVLTYMRARGLDHLTKDADLLRLFGVQTRDHPPGNPSHLVHSETPRFAPALYSATDVRLLLETAGFHRMHWMPAGFMDAFDTVPDYSAQSLRSAGVRSQDLQHYFIPYLRATVYASSKTLLPFSASRLYSEDAIAAILRNATLSGRVEIADRVGSIAKLYGSALDPSAAGGLQVVSFGPRAPTGISSKAVASSAAQRVAASLPADGSHVSMQDLKVQTAFGDKDVQDVARLIALLLRLQLLAVRCDGCSILSLLRRPVQQSSLPALQAILTSKNEYDVPPRVVILSDNCDEALESWVRGLQQGASIAFSSTCATPPPSSCLRSSSSPLVCQSGVQAGIEGLLGTVAGEMRVAMLFDECSSADGLLATAPVRALLARSTMLYVASPYSYTTEEFSADTESSDGLLRVRNCYEPRLFSSSLALLGEVTHLFGVGVAIRLRSGSDWKLSDVVATEMIDASTTKVAEDRHQPTVLERSAWGVQFALTSGDSTSSVVNSPTVDAVEASLLPQQEVMNGLGFEASAAQRALSSPTLLQNLPHLSLEASASTSIGSVSLTVGRAELLQSLQALADTLKTSAPAVSSASIPQVPSKAVGKSDGAESKLTRLLHLLSSSQNAGTASVVADDGPPRVHVTGRTASNPVADAPANSAELERIVEQSASIPLPLTLRTDQATIPSFRGPACTTMELSTTKQCLQPAPLKRRSAAVTATCPRKLRFDRAQLSHLLTDPDVELSIKEREGLHAAVVVVNELLRTHGDKSPDNQLLRLSKENARLVNKLLYSHGPSTSHGAQLSIESVRQLRMVVEQDYLSAHDFVVLDSVLQPGALRSLERHVLLSTHFFDTSAGEFFFAHHDDGFSAPLVVSLAQQLAAALRSPSTRWRVKKMLCIVTNTSAAVGISSSPLLLAGRSDLVLTLFLPASNPLRAQLHPSIIGEHLLVQGWSLYPTTHVDLLSRRGKLITDSDLDAQSLDSMETVGGQGNRLVVSRGDCPLQVAVEGTASVGAGFLQESAAAVVVVLARD